MSTTKKVNSNKHFTLNFVTSEITGFQSSFDKAGRGEKPYYQELTKLMKEHPTFTCAVKEMEKKSDKPKNTHEGLTFAFMRRYFIALMDNSADLMREMDSRMKNTKKLKLPVYPKTKKWFLSVVDPDGKGFDVNEALEKILEAETKKSLSNLKSAEDTKLEAVA